MANVTYIGPFDAVEVDMPNGGSRVVKHGEALSTTADHAESLLLQAPNWETTKKEAGKNKADESATNSEPETSKDNN